MDISHDNHDQTNIPFIQLQILKSPLEMFEFVVDAKKKNILIRERLVRGSPNSLLAK